MVNSYKTTLLLLRPKWVKSMLKIYLWLFWHRCHFQKNLKLFCWKFWPKERVYLAYFTLLYNPLPLRGYMRKCFSYAGLFKWIKNSHAFHYSSRSNLKLMVPMRPTGFLCTLSTFESLWYFWTVQFDLIPITIFSDLLLFEDRSLLGDGSP